jgi:hypothetical protein
MRCKMDDLRMPATTNGHHQLWKADLRVSRCLSMCCENVRVREQAAAAAAAARGWAGQSMRTRARPRCSL